MLLMKRRHRFLLVSVVFFTSNSLAVKPVSFDDNPVRTLLTAWKSSWVGAFSLGPVWENAGQTQNFFLAPNIQKTYVANHISHALFDGEVFVGAQKALGQHGEAQLGVAVVTTGNASLSGQVWDNAQAIFNNYTYRYQVRHTHIAGKGRFLFDRGLAVIPWVGGSLGVGFNRAHDFSNTPTIDEAVVMPNFSDNNTTAFTYTANAGVQRNLNKRWQLGIAYEFADWGKSQLGRAAGQTLNSGLALSHLYTHGFLVNLTAHA